ncbi:MAG: hypothetical protein IPI58_07380 [Alphaproteobacteria bacterium]|nr:MAG: hypothetical protein IPI58_07380 [Alphaproteobacteria bacterium]
MCTDHDKKRSGRGGFGLMQRLRRGVACVMLAACLNVTAPAPPAQAVLVGIDPVLVGIWTSILTSATGMFTFFSSIFLPFLQRAMAGVMESVRLRMTADSSMYDGLNVYNYQMARSRTSASLALMTAPPMTDSHCRVATYFYRQITAQNYSDRVYTGTMNAMVKCWAGDPQCDSFNGAMAQLTASLNDVGAVTDFSSGIYKNPPLASYVNADLNPGHLLHPEQPTIYTPGKEPVTPTHDKLRTACYETPDEEMKAIYYLFTACFSPGTIKNTVRGQLVATAEGLESHIAYERPAIAAMSLGCAPLVKAFAERRKITGTGTATNPTQCVAELRRRHEYLQYSSDQSWLGHLDTMNEAQLIKFSTLLEADLLYQQKRFKDLVEMLSMINGSSGILEMNRTLRPPPRGLTPTLKKT